MNVLFDDVQWTRSLSRGSSWLISIEWAEIGQIPNDGCVSQNDRFRFQHAFRVWADIIVDIYDVVDFVDVVWTIPQGLPIFHDDNIPISSYQYDTKLISNWYIEHVNKNNPCSDHNTFISWHKRRKQYRACCTFWWCSRTACSAAFMASSDQRFLLFILIHNHDTM